MAWATAIIWSSLPIAPTTRLLFLKMADEYSKPPHFRDTHIPPELTVTNEDGDLDKEIPTYQRQDFWATTANKQLNFMQHIRSMLKIAGQAAVVLPTTFCSRVVRAKPFVSNFSEAPT